MNQIPGRAAAPEASVAVPASFFRGLGYLFLFTMILPLAFYRGWAIHLLYTWFIVPCGAPPLSYLRCVGLSMVFGYIAVVAQQGKKLEKSSIGEDFKQVFAAQLAVLFSVGLGGLLHLLIGSAP